MLLFVSSVRRSCEDGKCAIAAAAEM